MLRPPLRAALLLALVLVAFAGLAWTNYRFAQDNPGGNDFLPRWVGTRLYLLEGQSPYSAESTQAIQETIYGRSAEAGEDQALFAYPLYAMLVFAPFAAIEDYALARALWMTTLEIGLFFTALLGMALSRWQPRRGLLIAFMLFALLWYHGARPVINGNAAVLVALLVTGSLWLLRARQDFWAGVLLALSSIKPQMVILLIPFLLIWAVSQRRLNLVLGFGLSMGLLLGVSFVVASDWLFANIAQVLAYSSYTPPGTLAGIFGAWWPQAGQVVGWGFSLFLALMLLLEWWAAFAEDFDWLLWTAALTLVASQFIGVHTTTANYAVLLPVLPLIFAAWQRRLGPRSAPVIWTSLGVLFIGLWLLFFITLLPVAQYREHVVMLLPLPLFLLLNLYWLRWWALHPKVLAKPSGRSLRRPGA